VLRVATDPDGFYRSADSGLVGPSIVVGLTGLALATTSVLSVLTAGASLSAGLTRGLTHAAGMFGFWIGVALVLSLTARVVGGGGGLVRTVAYVGYGFVPLLLKHTLTALAALPTAALGGRVAQNPVVAAMDTAAPTVAILLWAGFLWVFAVREARELSLRDAAVAVAVPVGILAAGQVIG
jgi:hypothetical protein